MTANTSGCMSLKNKQYSLQAHISWLNTTWPAQKSWSGRQLKYTNGWWGWWGGSGAGGPNWGLLTVDRNKTHRNACWFDSAVSYWNTTNTKRSFLWYFSILSADIFHRFLHVMCKFDGISPLCDFYVLFRAWLRWRDQRRHGRSAKLRASSISQPSMGSSSAQALGLPDFTVQHLWQCVPYIPLLTASSDPLLGLCSCVLLRSNSLLKWESLALSSLCLVSRWKRSTGWHGAAPADGGSHGVSPSPSLPKSPSSDRNQRRTKGSGALRPSGPCSLSG